MAFVMIRTGANLKNLGKIPHLEGKTTTVVIRGNFIVGWFTTVTKAIAQFAIQYWLQTVVTVLSELASAS
jgi:hypothetical protein